MTTEPALLAAHVCKAGALFGVAEGELVSNGAGGASGVGAADPNGQATPEKKGGNWAAKFTPRGTTYVFVNVVVAPRYVARVQPGSGGLKSMP